MQNEKPCEGGKSRLVTPENGISYVHVKLKLLSEIGQQTSIGSLRRQC